MRAASTLIFSDRARPVKVVVSLAAVLAMCLWSFSAPPLATLTDCLSAPIECDGQVLSTGSGGKVESVDVDGFWLSGGVWGEPVRVIGGAPGLRPGDTVFIEAVFHQDGFLELQDIYVSRYRDLRILVSVPAVLYVGWLVAASFLRPRKHA